MTKQAYPPSITGKGSRFPAGGIGHLANSVRKVSMASSGKSFFR